MINFLPDKLPPNDILGTNYGRMLVEVSNNNDFSELSIVLGERITGEPFYFDIEKVPHLLIAGAECMGKSVCLHTIICSFLMRFKPKDLNFLLIDPKKFEFGMYESLPHLALPVAKGIDSGIGALKWCEEEMERRYKILENIRVKNLHSIPAKERPFPIMAILVDELADYILSENNKDKEIENLIVRLSGKARAAGMHFIFATQMPWTNILTEGILSNFLGRVALKTNKAAESEIMLDRAGAETLMKIGEMLVKLPGYTEIIECQGAIIDGKHIEKLVKWWRRRA